MCFELIFESFERSETYVDEALIDDFACFPENIISAMHWIIAAFSSGLTVLSSPTRMGRLYFNATLIYYDNAMDEIGSRCTLALASILTYQHSQESLVP